MTRTRITKLDMESPSETVGDAFVADGSGNVIVSGVVLTDEKVGEIQQTDIQKATEVSILNFKGTAVNQITDVGGGQVDIDLSASGTGATQFTGLLDTPANYTTHAGKSVVVAGAEDALEFITISGGISSIQQDDIEVASGITTLNFEGGTSVADEGSGKVTITVSGTSNPDFTLWVPDAPPASGYSYFGTVDDEFNDSSFASGIWTELDQTSTQTVFEAEYGLYMQTTTTNNVQGIYQLVPSGVAEWSFTTYVGPTHEQADDQKPGILLIADVDNLASSDLYTWVSYRGSAGYGWQASLYDAYNNWNSDDYNNVSDSRPESMYLRFRLTGTTWHFDWSRDGYAWVCDRYTVAERFTIEGIGLGQRMTNTGTDWHAPFKFARFQNTGDADQMLYGDRIKMWRA
ncbi:hypothetical protein KAR91_79705 [Candidatus Pacearchaeota archaeon]|nr:hypothetical protein [Candidatus Pacearchaeota archaeon]